MDCSWLVHAARARRFALALGALACALALSLAGSSRAADPIPGVQADFRWTPAVAIVGQAVAFESTSQATGLGNTIVNYRWDLDGDSGNGFELDTGTTPGATASFSARGEIGVRLRAKDSFGNQNTIKKTLTVAGQAPSASYSFSPAAPLANEPVTFTSTAGDADGTLAELVWDLDGNGVYDNGAGPTALRSFPAAGAYVVGLRVADNDGATSFYSQTIVVRAPSLPAITKLQPSLRLLSPFPVVRIAGRLTRHGARLKRLSVNAPPGSKVLVRCKGRSCPYRTSVRIARGLRLRVFEKRLRAGVTIRIYVTSGAAIGKYTAFKIRKHRAPKRTDACLAPGSLKPVRCPAG
jgi:hypothetical protein